jgi:glycosyltransferase involved in cell wall biosynthesis
LYLLRSGHEPLVIAGATDEQLDGMEPLYRDGHLRAAHYRQDDIPVIACSNHPDTFEIYSRYDPAWAAAWEGVLSAWYGSDRSIQLLHLHAVSPLINTSLIEASRRLFPGIRVLYSYHVPESCPKGTLLYFEKSFCTIRPSAAVCTACLLQARSGWPVPIVRAIAALLPERKVFPAGAPVPFQLRRYLAAQIRTYGAFVNQVDRWLVFSRQVELLLRRLDVPADRIAMIRHGIDEVFLSKTEGGPTGDGRAESDRTTFVFIGRFKRVKGIATLLRAWMGSPPDAGRELLLMGGAEALDGELSDRLAEAARRPDIRQLGILPAEQVREVLRSAHCVVIPSEWVEIGPLTLHEAIACGANVITSDIGGCAELAEYYGDLCRTFRMGDAGDLWEKIRTFRYQPVTRTVASQSWHNARVVEEYRGLLAYASADTIEPT